MIGSNDISYSPDRAVCLIKYKFVNDLKFSHKTEAMGVTFLQNYRINVPDNFVLFLRIKNQY